MTYVIQTRYQGPTDRKGSRIIATCEGRRSSIHYDDALDSTANHRAAAIQLLAKLGFRNHETHGLIGGTVKGGHMVWLRDVLAEEVINWAETPQDHGGNPYTRDMVKIAQGRTR